MYIKQILIHDNGPIADINLTLPFNADGTPKPVFIVGGNGSGKTNLLSICADSFFEAAAAHYSDVVPNSTPMSRSWFRVVGSVTVRTGAAFSVSVVELIDGAASYVYWEKAGTVPAEAVQQILPDHLRQHADWPQEGNAKKLAIADADSQRIFSEGAYLYFPSNRSEHPSWLNRDSIPESRSEFRPKFAKELGRQIFVEQGLEAFKRWLVGLITDVRADVAPAQMAQGGFNVGLWIATDPVFAQRQHATFLAANQMLRTILNNPDASFVWLGRRNPQRVGYRMSANGQALPLDSLSMGQATLLSVFGTLLAWGDGTPGGYTKPREIVGVCLIDEIDAHLHVDLQHRALPDLVNMFPKVQFLITNHSPIVVLGIELSRGANGYALIDMPSGQAISSEAYREFEHAFSVLKGTQAFAKAVLDEVRATEKPIVLCEGETDPMYLLAACAALGRNDLVEAADFKWVGAKDPGGQAFNTGKDAMNHTLRVLKANPGLVLRTVVMLYDNDVHRAAEDLDLLHVRVLNRNPDNNTVTAGIENLLPVHAFTDDDYDTKETHKANGDTITARTLNKMQMCQRLVRAPDPGTFAAFAVVLDMLTPLIQAPPAHALAQ